MVSTKFRLHLFGATLELSSRVENGLENAHILVKHLDSKGGVEELALAGGTFRRISQNANGRKLLENCQALFVGHGIEFGDWLFEKVYEKVPPSRTGADPALTGDIPFEIEDLLLALRLLHPGDISFIAQTISGDDGSQLSQMPYRYFAEIASTKPYRFDPGEAAKVESILALLKKPAATSMWFSVAKRFFLYGGAKEFNTYAGELDRILDYSIALEAVLMCETHFINRMIKRRAIALLKIPEDQAADVSRFIGTFYGYRSTIAHGEPLKDRNLDDIRGRMEIFESFVRGVLLAALEMIPADDASRKAQLTALAAVTESEKIDYLITLAKELKDENRQNSVIAALQA